MADNIQRDIGALSASIEALKEQVAQISVVLNDTREIVLDARGRWRGMALLASLIGGVSGYALSLIKIKIGGD